MNNELEFQCKNRNQDKKGIKKEVEKQLIWQRDSRAPLLISCLHALNAKQ